MADHTMSASIDCQSQYSCQSITVSHQNNSTIDSPTLKIKATNTSGSGDAESNGNVFDNAYFEINNNVTLYLTSNTYLGLYNARINGNYGQDVIIDCGYDNNDDELMWTSGFCKGLVVNAPTINGKVVIKSGRNGISDSQIICPKNEMNGYMSIYF